MTKLVVGIGIPGSGKTTMLKAFAEKNGYVYICPDDIRVELTGGYTNERDREVWDLARQRMLESFQKGESVVFDATQYRPNDRKDLLKFARENGAEHIQGVFADVPYEVAKERNQNRERVVPEHAMERMNDALKATPPMIEDGFDALFTIDEFQKMVTAERDLGENVEMKRFR